MAAAAATAAVSASSASCDAFKKLQTRHKKSPRLLVDELVDFQSSGSAKDRRIIRLRNPLHSDHGCGDGSSSSTECSYRGPLFGLASHPGFVFAPSALSPDVQIELAHDALTKYCERPHRTNIDLIPVKEGIEIDDPNVRMFQLWKDANGFPETVDSNNWKMWADNDGNYSRHTCKAMKRQKTEDAKKQYRSPKKLSWSTLGYHYDWNARSYTEESKSKMPVRLQQLATNLARLVDDETFSAQAAIVNFYNHKSLMGGHRDDLEFDFRKPVISISLGLPAVFLIGGKTRDEVPVAILVRPGDIMYLAGESRLAYHGMAKCISTIDDVPPIADVAGAADVWINAFTEDGKETASTLDSERNAVKAYLITHRININLRQVLPDGVQRITSDMKPPV